LSSTFSFSIENPLSFAYFFQMRPTAARSVFTYLAVEETGHSAADVARVLGVKRMSVHEAVVRGRALCAEHAVEGIEK
jgi:DNA-directed RNA polymerase specialized sigma24 family protein